VSLGLWGGYELLADDGARLRLARPGAVFGRLAAARGQGRATGADKPTIDSSE
jgi:hypothetical protein